MVAEENDHRVLITPPYHCELQPIELVWEVVKGKVGRQSSICKSMSDVKRRLFDEFQRLETTEDDQLLENIVKHFRKHVERYKE